MLVPDPSRPLITIPTPGPTLRHSKHPRIAVLAAKETKSGYIFIICSHTVHKAFIHPALHIQGCMNTSITLTTASSPRRNRKYGRFEQCLSEPPTDAPVYGFLEEVICFSLFVEVTGYKERGDIRQRTRRIEGRAGKGKLEKRGPGRSQERGWKRKRGVGTGKFEDCEKDWVEVEIRDREGRRDSEEGKRFEARNMFSRKEGRKERLRQGRK